MSKGNKLLRRRFTVIFALYTALVLLVWIMLHYTVFSYMRDTDRYTLELAKNSLLAALDDELSQRTMISAALAGSSYVLDFLEEDDINAYYEKAKTVSEIISNSTYPFLNSDSIVTVTEDGLIYRFTGGIGAAALDEMYNNVIMDGAPAYSIRSLAGTEYFCLVSPVSPQRRGEQQSAGYVVTLSNTAKLRRTIMELESVNGIHCAVILDDVILLSDNPELDGMPVSELERIYGAVSLSRVSGTNLHIAAAISRDAQSLSTRLSLVVSFAVLVILASAIVILYRVLSLRTINPMIEMSDNMHMGLLKTQISSHFIVNTIDCIESLSAQGQNEKAAACARNLARMLRALHASGEEVNIYEQLENLNNYIEIMNIRNDGKFIVDIDADDRLVEYLMPIQVLQPLVENALTHGLGNVSHDCRLTIKATAAPECVHIEVSDNGHGLETASVRAFQEMLDTADDWEDDKYNLRGVALLNIQRRLRARYGKDYGLTIKSSPGMGFTVTVRLPYVKDGV